MLKYLLVTAQVAPNSQCGGAGWTGFTACTPGYVCTELVSDYSQCLPGPVPAGDVVPYEQCGGLGYTGLTQCSLGFICSVTTEYFSQCIPIAEPAEDQNTQKFSTSSRSKITKYSSRTTLSTSFSSTKTVSLTSKTRSTTSTNSTRKRSSTSSTTLSTVTKIASHVVTVPKAPTSTTSTTLSTVTTLASNVVTIPNAPTMASPPGCAVSNSPGPGAGAIQLTGVNIAGCENGTSTNGDQNLGSTGANCPLGPTYGSSYSDGPGQMVHFAQDDLFNAFRLPVSWEFITNSETATNKLDATNFAQYDFLVQQCLLTRSYCIIDIHNYARFGGKIIGQGGPSNAMFAALWSSIATKYKDDGQVIFGLMNGPHDIPKITQWAATCQAAVTAIRKAGAVSQIILLPGNGYSSATVFVSDGSAAALSKIKNLDGSLTNLVFDVHQYLDADGSGTSPDCVGDSINSAFAPLAQWLRCNGRQALLSETGGGSTPTCGTFLCGAVAFLNANSDVYLGYIGWAAGSFSTSYDFSLVPTNTSVFWTDTPILSCLLPIYLPGDGFGL